MLTKTQSVIISRILVVSLGSIGLRHLKILRGIFPQADIRVLRHTKNSICPKYADGIFYKLEESLKFLPQIAIISSPAPFHIATANALAKLKCHLLIEKPISTNMKDIDKLIKYRNQFNLKIQIGYNLRFDNSLKFFKKSLEKGFIGKIYSVRSEAGSYLPNWRPNSDYRNTVSSIQKLGGGVLLELSHEIDYINWLFGKVEFVNCLHLKHSNLNINVEDTAYLNLLINTDNSKNKIITNLNIDFIRQDPSRKCIVIGEEGSIRWDFNQGCVEIWKKGSSRWKKLFHKSPSIDQTYIAQLKSFINSIKKNQETRVTIEDGLNCLSVIMSAKNSNEKKGKLIKVKYAQ